MHPQSIHLSSQEGRILQTIQAKDFYEQSHFFLDTIHKDFCEDKPDGWFEFKQPVDIAAQRAPADTTILHLRGGFCCEMAGPHVW